MSEETRDVEIVESEDQLGKASEIARQAMATEINLADTDIKLDLGRATKVPFTELTALGTAFAGISPTFQTITQTIEIPGEGLFRAVDATGNILSAEALHTFKNSKDKLGSFRDATNRLKQAHLQEVGGQTAEVITKVPVDPATMAIAAALLEINKKLDEIQETQEEMFEYLKNKDRAEQRGNLETLADIMNNYKFHWDNDDYKKAKLIQVQGIQQKARQSSIHHRAQIEGALDKKALVHLDKDVRKKTETVRSELEEYRIAVYLYGFSSFLEVMLHENFDQEYLESVRSEIEGRSIDYRKLYTKAYNEIDKDAGSSIRAGLLGGASKATGFLSKKIEATRLGDATPIDEALALASKGIGEFSEKVHSDMLDKLIDASYSDVKPFMDNIDSVNRLYNEPVMLLANDETLYLLPA